MFERNPMQSLRELQETEVVHLTLLELSNISRKKLETSKLERTIRTVYQKQQIVHVIATEIRGKTFRPEKEKD